MCWLTLAVHCPSIGIHHRHLHSPEKIQLKVLNDEFFDNLLETPLHATQFVVNDKKKIIEIEVFDTFELESLLLSYGPQIQIIAPLKIKEKIKQKLTESLQLYK